MKERAIDECLDYELEPAPDDSGAVSQSEYHLRVDALRRVMAKKGIHVALIHNSRDLYYYAGTALNCFLVLPGRGDPVLLCRINVARARRDSWISDVRSSTGLGELKLAVDELGLDHPVIGYEEDVTPVSLYRKWCEMFPGAVFADISPTVLDQRMVKSPAEIAMVRRAAAISDIGFRRATSVLRPGITEIDASAKVEEAKRLAGHDGGMIARRPGSIPPAVYVASGPNTAVVSGYVITNTGPGPSNAFPYGPATRRMRRGDTVVVDHGTMYLGYHCDEARTYVLGKLRDRHKQVFGVVREAMDAAIATIRPGVPASEVYLAAWRVARDAGYEKYFMDYGEYAVEYVGHGLGLEIDEPPLIGPRTGTLLEEGMTLALEPKVIIPGWGGMNIEDTIEVTCDGCNVLTTGKHELIELG